MREIRDRAKPRMKAFCRVCKICDGRACAGEIPGMGGIGTGASFKNNVAALAAIRLNMRLIHGVTAPRAETSLFGMPLALPALAAPIGGVAVNMDLGVPEEEYDEAVVAGCLEAGTLACTGDGVQPRIHEAAFAAIRRHGGAAIPFIKPWEGPELAEKLEKARDAGCKAVGVDIDAAGLLTLRQKGKPVAPRTPEELSRIIDLVHGWGLRFILKGLMTPKDAVLAVNAGADAVAVSNHGGRALDHLPGTAEVLPAIARAVDGKAVVIADGGVRDGADVLKMLALGADLVLIGRPVTVAAVGGGGEGVARYFTLLKDQLLQAMIMTGVADATAVDGSILFDRPSGPPSRPDAG